MSKQTEMILTCNLKQLSTIMSKQTETSLTCNLKQLRTDWLFFGTTQYDLLRNHP